MRYEVRDGWFGSLKAIIEPSDPVLTRRVGGEGGFTCTVPVGNALAGTDTLARAQADAYAEIKTGRIIRIVYDDGVFVEQRVLEVGDVTNGNATLRCGGLSTVLSATPPIKEASGSGYTFDGVGLSAESHLTNYLKPAWDAAGLTFLEIGEVLTTASVDIAYDVDTVWTALAKLKEATGHEASFRWDLDGETVYLDLIPTDGTSRIDGSLESDLSPSATFGDTITNDGPRLEAGHNAEIKRTRVIAEQRSRIYGVGAEGVGIGEALWVVDAIDGNDITLADLGGGAGPIGFDDQLNGLYLEAADRTTRVAITDCAVDTQIATVTSASAFTVGDRVKVRADVNGTPVAYLDDPTATGNEVGIIKRPDIPETVNLVVNADQSVWSNPSAAADSWAAVNGATLTRNTTDAHRQIGPYSCLVETDADGEGYASPLVDVLLTPDNPYVSGFMSFKLISGKVRIEMVATDGVDSWIFPDGVTQEAVTTVTGVWTQVGVRGIDLFASGVTAVRVRLVQSGTGTASFYVDAAQVTETPAQLPFVIGSGVTQLWQAVNKELAYSGNRARYEGRLVDFYRLAPEEYPYHRLELGALHTVADHQLGIVEGVRLLEVAEHLHRQGDTTVRLSNLPEDLRSLRQREARQRLTSAVAGTRLVARSLSARTFADAMATASDETLTSEAADFTEADVGQTLWVFGAGASGAILKTTVASVTAENEIEMADAASTTISNAVAVLGTPEGVLTLAASVNRGGGGGDPEDLSTALLEAAIRELARRLAEIETTVGEGGEGEVGPQGPPGNGYEPYTIEVTTDSVEPGNPVVAVFDAPAIGVVLDVTTIPPSTVEIYGGSDTGALDPELALTPEAVLHRVIPAGLVANRSAVEQDQWYMVVTPTSSSWNAVGSTVITAELESFPDSAPFDEVVPFTSPGGTGITGWYSAAPEDYSFSTYLVVIGEAGEGAHGDSNYPMLVNAPVSESATTISAWAQLFIGVADTDPHSFSLVLSADEDGAVSQIEARISYQFDGDSTTTFTLEIAYTNSGGTRTVLDSDASTSIPISGHGVFGLKLDLVRNAWNDYDISAAFARESEVAISGDPAEMTIGTPDLTASKAGQTVTTAHHSYTGFRLINCDIDDMEASHPPISLLEYGMGWDNEAEEDGVDVKLRVMPLFWREPPEEEEP